MQRRTQHYLSILSVTHNHKLCCLNMRNLSFRVLGWSDDDGKLYFGLEALGKCASCFFYILECFLASLLVLTSSVFSLIFICINSFNSYCILFSLLPLSVYMCVHVSSCICDMSCFQISGPLDFIAVVICVLGTKHRFHIRFIGSWLCYLITILLAPKIFYLYEFIVHNFNNAFLVYHTLFCFY